MPSWFFIALAGPFFWSISCIIDKYLVEKFSDENHGSGALVIFSSLIGIFIAIAIGIFTDGIWGISILDKLLLILVGILSIIWVILYLFTLEIEDVSSVAPWFLIVPIFGYILGNIFLGENLNNNQIIGSLIILLGVFIISFDFTNKRIKIKPAIYMTIVSFIVAIIGIIFKFVTIEGNFWVSSFWEYIGLGLSGIIIFIFVPKYRNNFISMNKIGGIKIFILNASNELITIAGNLLANFAILLAPVALVYLFESFQPVILLVMTIIGTKLFPKIIKENLDRKVLIPKIIAIFIIFIGGLFLI